MAEPEEKPKLVFPTETTQETKKTPGRRKLEEIALRKRIIKTERQEFKRRRRKDELCAYCGHRQAITTEHFIPQSSNLEIAFKKVNLIPACRSCNSFKGGRWPNEKEIQWFFQYWKKQLQDIESHLKIAEALKRNRHGKIEEREEKENGKRTDYPGTKRRHRRRRVHGKSGR